MIDSTLLRTLVFGLTLLTAGSGCSDLRNCAEEKSEPIPGGVDHPVVDKQLKTYWSAAPGYDLDAFPAKTKLLFEHHLGFVPAVVNVYLSFEAHGTNGSGAGSISPSAGNQSLIDRWDAEAIEVRNDTCENGFYILVTATGEVPAGGAADSDDAAATNGAGGTGATGGAGVE